MKLEKLNNDIKKLKIKSLFSMYLTNTKYHYKSSLSFLVNNFKEFVTYFTGFIIALILLPILFLITVISLIIVYIKRLHQLKTENKEKRIGIDYSYYVVTDRENELNKWYDDVYIYHRLRLIEYKKELSNNEINNDINKN